MDDIETVRAEELDKVVKYLRGKDVRFERVMNSRREETLALALREVEDVYVLVEFMGKGDYRYRLTLVSEQQGTKQVLFIGGVMSAYFVYRMYMDANLFVFEATPEDHAEVMQDPMREAFAAGFIEGRI